MLLVNNGRAVSHEWSTSLMSLGTRIQVAGKNSHHPQVGVVLGFGDRRETHMLHPRMAQFALDRLTVRRGLLPMARFILRMSQPPSIPTTAGKRFQS